MASIIDKDKGHNYKPYSLVMPATEKQRRSKMYELEQSLKATGKVVNKGRE